MADIQGIIDQIMNDERLKRSSHFSDTVFGSEPILKTGRQMSSYLPDRYREMRAISRWQEGAGGRAGRWLTEAELFVRQAEFMADFEDDCPYRGDFVAYFPTYGSLNDRQLRGYFTWRARVRSGDVPPAPTSFAYLYLYELIAGVGYEDPADGLRLMQRFCDAFSAHDRAILRLGSVWMQDFAVYHALPADLLGDTRTLRHDRALVELRRTTATALDARAHAARALGRKAPKGLPLPAQQDLESALIAALDELSSYRICSGKLYREQPEAVAHVAGSVWLRLADHYARSRASDVIERLFGSSAELPYTIFASAVFFDPLPHPDSVYELDPVHRYRCRNGLWTCERVHGAVGRSPKLGSVLRAVDGRLRAAVGFGHPLKEEKVPKYLAAIIDAEAAAWASWHEAHAPRRIAIDLSRLAEIRQTAEETREALLVDEEREGAGSMLDAADRAGVFSGRDADGHEAATDPDRTQAEPTAAEGADGPFAPDGPAPRPAGRTKSRPAATTRDGADAAGRATDAPASPAPAGNHPHGLDGPQASFLRALLEGDPERVAESAREAGTTVDLLADAVNVALFDALGDTAVEFDANGPHIVEDYREDIEELLAHA